jgi:uncharacterized membrane protein YhaH (DUF805 family)
MTVVSLLLLPVGRLDRLSYLLCFLSLAAIDALLYAILNATGLPQSAPLAYTGIKLIVCYPNWVVATKRAHDFDRSGWWLLAWSIGGVAAAAAFLAAARSPDLESYGMALVLSTMSVACSIAMLWQAVVKLFFFSGTHSSNMYGPPVNLVWNIYASDDPLRIPNVSVGTLGSATASAAAKPLTASDTTRPVRALQSGGTPTGFGRRGLNPT